MSTTYFALAQREKAILAGLYLAKFDAAGLQRLGFEGFRTAYNAFGFALGEKPKNIQNYRDEFDPVFPNPRRGRANRPMRSYCQSILAQFGSLPLAAFTDLVREMLYRDPDIEQLLETLQEEVPGSPSAFAKRLLTGLAAERYFQAQYPSLPVFEQQPLEDTTALGCGFDFRVTTPTGFYGVEVKGLTERNGRIQLTEKEHRVAGLLGERYFLFVVKNFRDQPFHELIQHPLASHLQFTSTTRQVTQTSWQATV